MRIFASLASDLPVTQWNRLEPLQKPSVGIAMPEVGYAGMNCAVWWTFCCTW